MASSYAHGRRYIVLGQQRGRDVALSTHLSHAVQNVNRHIDMKIKQEQQIMRTWYLLYSFVECHRLVKFTGQFDNSVPASQKGSVERFGQVDILTLKISNNNVEVRITR